MAGSKSKKKGHRDTYAQKENNVKTHRVQCDNGGRDQNDVSTDKECQGLLTSTRNGEEAKQGLHLELPDIA